MRIEEEAGMKRREREGMEGWEMEGWTSTLYKGDRCLYLTFSRNWLKPITVHVRVPVLT